MLKKIKYKDYINFPRRHGNNVFYLIFFIVFTIILLLLYFLVPFVLLKKYIIIK